jgi:hypothetical protein
MATFFGDDLCSTDPASVPYDERCNGGGDSSGFGRGGPPSSDQSPSKLPQQNCSFIPTWRRFDTRNTLEYRTFQPLEDLQQRRTERAQLFEVDRGEQSETMLGGVGQSKDNAAAIFGIMFTGAKIGIDQPIDQLDRAMVANA